MLDITLKNIDDLLPVNFTPEQKASAKTLFLKKLSLEMHKFYGGKISTIPKAGLFGFNWFNIWYTPGVSSVSTEIRDNNNASFDLTNRNNLVAIVSDSTRVLGDGDCTPSGGLGVMEGKSFLMKYLGGVDGIPLCIDSRDENGENNPDKIIDFVKMVQPGFGAVNLEDISQPNCYKVLDVLRKECDIPVWHDDAQGTGCVTLAGLINSLRVVNKKIEEVKIVLLGAGASNTTIARLIIKSGGNPENIILFDSKGGLHKNRNDIMSDEKFYRKQQLCLSTNPNCINDIESAIKNADVLISLSIPGPDVIKPDWIKTMSDKAIVFACANPVPEIYPHSAKQAGAYIVATGRGDFPNQVNNSLCFPGLLKGTLLVRAGKITDDMAIAASYAIADYAADKGLSPNYIIPDMDETEMFAKVAAAVGKKARTDGVSRVSITPEEIFDITYNEIIENRKLFNSLMEQDYIKKPDLKIIERILEETIKEKRGQL